MRRAGVMLALAAVAAVIFPPPAPAGESGPAGFTLGGTPCTLIPVPVVAPAGTGPCEGVRPGGRLETEIGLCTYNFLFSAPDGSRYIGTAGHCILGTTPVAGSAGEKLWPKGGGPTAKTGGKRVGEFAYAVLEDPKDFALIRLDPGVEASAEMCHFGGPTGTFEGHSPDPTVVEYYGNGVGIGSTLPARSGMAIGVPNDDHVYALGLALPGDSGSGVISDGGLAIGVLVTTGLHGFGFDENGLDFGTMGITRIGPQIARASEALGFPLTLVTAG
ncbi:MAG: hypothetical protein ACRDYV_03405 [Acidimicrobiia bacterium]